MIGMFCATVLMLIELTSIKPFDVLLLLSMDFCTLLLQVVLCYMNDTTLVM